MNDRKFRSTEVAANDPSWKHFDHLQHVAGLSPEGRERFNNALRETVEHVEKTHGLQYGMQGKHVEEAFHFLDNKYKERHQLKEHEREALKTSLSKHFNLKSELKAVDVKPAANDESFGEEKKAA